MSDDYLSSDDLLDLELVLMSEQSLTLDQQRSLIAEVRRQERVIDRQHTNMERQQEVIDQVRREYMKLLEKCES